MNRKDAETQRKIIATEVETRFCLYPRQTRLIIGIRTLSGLKVTTSLRAKLQGFQQRVKTL